MSWLIVEGTTDPWECTMSSTDSVTTVCARTVIGIGVSLAGSSAGDVAINVAAMERKAATMIAGMTKVLIIV
jgi:hypothetical protein